MENVETKSKQSKASIILYVAAAVVAIIGIALLVDNIIVYRKALSQYVAQGYKAATVNSQLVPQQLLPEIFNAVGIYGGIAFVLFGAGIINNKISKLLSLHND
ncbi:hypothetical protein BJV85_002455 [Clostridium acetobutylicum]|uniref:Predicted membrane protein n=1 Tax=Clostridium acetobutylicum (strain ATCC 824 / DSM 792 / JCM 1419 / IAM 19013 / LMG 5710 / NBRC 13948 / NRRL B-527 / VKM B-1787 / 2291 / W) TaxID=272562 RepID=Q97IU8_CLOAB|nr:MULTISPECIES: membrane protein [Clostridium]AAK79509.1 Predicted membrane protein [Clostridium acetobutylicum ATCC 824]ADZ20594.1 membrane protein [Clostridium acetobutylicum EA 2018]AEI31863.1 hypothetical protein SMB_G1567 [Clostridium acetobutylicum DSM 1731]AWV82244.1 hypothetical protein DK921_14330 [Clostridium acetobutylicum]KHD36337.1 membrane protein [Clostridium acetobutylicum]